ncbi:hypothetical protein [Pseudooceanicola atlanticus]|uniref:hypothetical protein n=1 Tax=Pseudooceanicola atlanticus TaxID=1461694 RepID=UPI002354618A|nr:hypothetical protein [Pseudooceanicola atlanticus]
MATWPTPMAGTPAQNGNSAAGNSDFSRRAEELAAGLWKTPSAQEPGVEHRPLVNADGAPWMGGERAYDAETGRLVQTGLPQMVKATQAQWATPAPMQTREGWTPEQIEEARAKEKAKGQNGNGFGIGLAAQSTMWTTPQAHDVSPRGSGQKPTAAAGNACLARDAMTWPTPASRDHKGENSADHLTNGTGRLHMDQLPNAVAHGFTRPAPEIAPHGPMSWPQTRLALLLLRAAMSKPPRSVLRPYSPPTRRKPSSIARAKWRSAQSYRRWSEKRRNWWNKPRLSPGFVTWLMGWPRGHALSACSATAFTRWQQDMRGALSALPMASGPWIWKPPVETPTALQLSLL